MPEDAIAPTEGTVAGPHGPVPVRWYPPQPGAPVTGGAPIVWVHGGAFLRSDLDLDLPETHEVAQALAGAGFRVVTVDYRLAGFPGVRRLGLTTAAAIRYPVPVDDVLAVVRAVQRDHEDGVILGGASCRRVPCRRCGAAARGRR